MNFIWVGFLSWGLAGLYWIDPANKFSGSWPKERLGIVVLALLNGGLLVGWPAFLALYR